MFYMPMKYSVI